MLQVKMHLGGGHDLGRVKDHGARWLLAPVIESLVALSRRTQLIQRALPID